MILNSGMLSRVLFAWEFMRMGNHAPFSVTFVATSSRRHIPVVGERSGKKDARKLEYAWLGCSFPIDTISLIIFEERRISAGSSAWRTQVVSM